MSTVNLWDTYHLTLVRDNIAGGLPTDPRLIDAWQQARWSKAAKLLPEDPKTPAEAVENTLELLPGVPEEAGWTTFARDPAGHLCLEGRQVKAALKESANVLKGLLPVNGKVIPLRSKLAERVFVKERLLPLLRDGRPLTEPDGTVERPIHVMTAQGPRSALKRADVCNEVYVECTLVVVRDGLVTEPMLRTLLDHIDENGLGADRSQGYGVGSYTLTKH